MVNLFDFILLSIYFICISSIINDIPTQIHMAQGKTPETMIISWITKTNIKTQIAYNHYNIPITRFMNSNYTTQYRFNYYPYENYTSGYIHHILIDKLNSETLYIYECGDFDLGLTSKSYFKTLSNVGFQYSPTVFGIIANLELDSKDKFILTQLIKNKFIKMIIQIGGLSHANCNQTLWDDFGKMIEPLSKKIPWMIIPSNYEIEFNPGDLQTNLYLSFESRYKMPMIKPTLYGSIISNISVNPLTNTPYCSPKNFQSEYDYGNSFYSFDTGLTHFIFLNGYTRTDNNSNQYKWLLSDLKSTDRRITPWIIVVSNFPIYYNKQLENKTQILLMKKSFEPIFFEYKVNLILSNYPNTYERTFPVYEEQININGPVYIVISNKDNYEYNDEDNYEYNNVDNNGISINKQNWIAYKNTSYFGYGLLSIVNAFELNWKWFSNIDNKLILQDNFILNNFILDNNFQKKYIRRR